MDEIILVTAVDIKVFDPAEIQKRENGQPYLHTDEGSEIDINPHHQFVNDNGKVVMIEWGKNLQKTLGLPFRKFTEYELVIKKLRIIINDMQKNGNDMLANRDTVINRYENMSPWNHILLGVSKLGIKQLKTVVKFIAIVIFLRYIFSM